MKEQNGLYRKYNILCPIRYGYESTDSVYLTRANLFRKFSLYFEVLFSNAYTPTPLLVSSLLFSMITTEYGLTRTSPSIYPGSSNMMPSLSPSFTLMTPATCL
uniref:Uncharacterized protein n=1 Tax=Cacopsylla melanoneura TaxID=428564 RepID=A0A8D8T9Q9_9HEMI